jgi:exonuclease VII small subunit
MRRVKREGRAPSARPARAAAREEEVHRLEDQIAELEAAIADPALYDGGAEGGPRCGAPGSGAQGGEAGLDQAMARWTEAVEALDAPAR